MFLVECYKYKEVDPYIFLYHFLAFDRKNLRLLSQLYHGMPLGRRLQRATSKLLATKLSLFGSSRRDSPEHGPIESYRDCVRGILSPTQ